VDFVDLDAVGTLGELEDVTLEETLGGELVEASVEVGLVVGVGLDLLGHFGVVLAELLMLGVLVDEWLVNHDEFVGVHGLIGPVGVLLGGKLLILHFF
jgi:hypothetical protein